MDRGDWEIVSMVTRRGWRRVAGTAGRPAGRHGPSGRHGCPSGRHGAADLESRHNCNNDMGDRAGQARTPWPGHDMAAPAHLGRMDVTSRPARQGRNGRTSTGMAALHNRNDRTTRPEWRTRPEQSVPHGRNGRQHKQPEWSALYGRNGVTTRPGMAGTEDPGAPK